MKPVNWLHLVSALCLSFSVMTGVQAQAPVEGKDYKPIVPPQAKTGSNVEVIEFFSYACPHCADFEPALQSWVKRKPKDVDYKLVPMVFRDSWKAPAKLYYTLETMGVIGTYHQKVFDAINKEGKELFTDQAVKDWAKSVGIDVAKFNQVYDSFGIDAKLQNSAVMGKAYNIGFTPAMAINGKYWTGPSMTAVPGSGTDYARFFVVLDQLIDAQRVKAEPKKTEKPQKPQAKPEKKT